MLSCYSEIQYCRLGKPTIGYFWVKVVCGKIYLFIGYLLKFFLTILRVELFIALLANSVHNQYCTIISHEHRHTLILTDHGVYVLIIRSWYILWVALIEVIHIKRLICTRIPISQRYRYAVFIKCPSVTKN